MEQEGQRSHCAWGDDERANILNSSNYREQSQGSMRSGSAGAATGYSGKLQAHAHLVTANSLRSVNPLNVLVTRF
jgi:hypothetical protein